MGNGPSQEGGNNVPRKASLRKFPYPYRAMLAICSDLDETPDRDCYWRIMRFLNTNEDTPMGPGVGLEVGNSVYFDMPPGQFAYWNTDDAGREMVRALIRSGHVDCLHSYGDLAVTRGHAGKALDELDRHDCRLAVWVDHGKAATNFGADIMHGHGDEVGHPAYHADLTMAHGIRYVWRGRVTSLIGQDAPPRYGGLFQARHPAASAKTIAKEAAKRTLGRLGWCKYRIHGANRVLRKSSLRDGSAVWEFMRCNPHWGGVSCCETGRDIGQVLTDDVLGRLVERQGACILYTHLGKVDDPRVPFSASAMAAFRRLAQAHRAGRILVTTTRRALAYLEARDRVGLSVTRDGRRLDVNTRTDPSAGPCLTGMPPAELAGLTFYVADAARCRVIVNGSPVEVMRPNPPDRTGHASLSIPWPALEFPRI